MDRITQQINSINHKIHSYDQMRKIIVNLGSIKGNSSPKLSHLYNKLPMRVVDIPKKWFI